ALTYGPDAGNVIAHNGGDPATAQAGILIGEPDAGAGELDDPYANLMLTNSIFDNAGEGISIDYYPGDEGNRNIAKPSVTTALPTFVAGTTNLPAAAAPMVQAFM